MVGLSPICVIPTFLPGSARSAKEVLASGGSVSTATMHDLQETNLNPDLVKCGKLPGCRTCGIHPEKLDRQSRMAAASVTPDQHLAALGGTVERVASKRATSILG